MTALMDHPTAISLPDRIPAWGISVDLTPREVVQGRQTKVVQRLVVLGLIVVLLACGGLGLMAFGDRSSAQSGYDDAQTQTTQLQSAAHEYDALVAMTRVKEQTDASASTLMSQDVDFVKLMARIRQALPAGVTIGNLAVLLAPELATADTTSTTPSTGTGTDDTGTDDIGTSIGTITIAGAGTRIKALAPFVARLNHMAGIADVVPTSTTQTETGMVYTLTMNFTDELYSHRFDPATTDGAAPQGSVR